MSIGGGVNVGGGMSMGGGVIISMGGGVACEKCCEHGWRWECGWKCEYGWSMSMGGGRGSEGVGMCGCDYGECMNEGEM